MIFSLENFQTNFSSRPVDIVAIRVSCTVFDDFSRSVGRFIIFFNGFQLCERKRCGRTWFSNKPAINREYAP